MLRNKYESSIIMLKNNSLSKLKSDMKHHFSKDKKLLSLINKIPTKDKCLQNNINKLCSSNKYKNMIFNVVKSKLMEGAKPVVKAVVKVPVVKPVVKAVVKRSKPVVKGT